MKIAAFTALGAALVSAESVSDAFEQFKITFGRVYESAERERAALSAFTANLIKIEERNALGGAVHGINRFSDLTPEEFKSQYLNFVPSRSNKDRVVQDKASLPAPLASIDWTDRSAFPFNITTPVKNQGRCGSCWTFSAVEQIETVYAMTNKVDAPEFSTQQVVACDTGSAGCNGGDTISAFDYIQYFGGLESARDYPDTSSRGGRTGKCEADKSLIVNGTQVDEIIFCLDECTRGACKTTEQDTETAKQCISQAPQSICVNAEAWQTYVSGVLTDRECGSHAARALDHCIQVVGYNTEAPEPYYIVRNSWDTTWGYEGMIHLSMNGNTCGILDEMTTVTLK